MTTFQLPLTALAAFAAGLCQDAGIVLKLGRRWRFNPARREIEIDARQFRDARPEAAGLLFHEVGHVWISRYHHFTPRGLSPELWRELMNMLEDPRVNGWMRWRLPGSEPFFQMMFEADRDAAVDTPSRFLRWGAAVSVADAYDWDGEPGWIAGCPSVQAGYRATLAARRCYAEEVPPPSLIHCQARCVLPSDLAARWRKGSPPPHINPIEVEILASAGRAMLIAEWEVLPAVRRLIEEDVDAITGFLAREPRLAAQLPDALHEDGAFAEQVIEHALAAPPKQTPHGDRTLSRRAFEWFVSRQRPATRIGIAADGEGVPGKPTPWILGGAESQSADPAELEAAVRSQVPRLLRDLQAVLAPWQRRRLQSGHATGTCVDLRRAMAFEAKRRGHDKLWQRRQRPGRPHAVVSLLVDLSGSMRGEKIAAAAAGTLLLAETLDCLAPAVRFAINGFQDEVIPVHPFDEPLSPASRARILEMADEVEGERKGGHNCPRWNDDAPCLAAAAEALAREPGQRLLIVVSDGRPAGRRSDEADLKAQVQRLSRDDAGLTLFGLGLGEGTNHVTDFYPNAIANIPVTRFADEIGQLLTSVLLAPQR